MGGVATAEDCEKFACAGSDIIGVGSSLTGLSTEELVVRFAELAGSGKPVGREVPADLMHFKEFTLERKARGDTPYEISEEEVVVNDWCDKMRKEFHKKKEKMKQDYDAKTPMEKKIFAQQASLMLRERMQRREQFRQFKANKEK